MPSWMDDDLAERQRQGLYRSRRRLQSAQGVRIRLRGRELLNFASNDYLNLAADPRLARAAARAARRHGCGAGSSALVAGYLPPHRALERALAAWEGTEAALVFSSGYAANLAAVTAVAGHEDAIFSDELNHASLIDGCRLARSRLHVYRHGDVDHLHDLLRREGPGVRRRLIVTDTVFSMDGDLAPLADLAELARRHDCLLLIDEAHATGVLGGHGRGVTDLLPPTALEPERLIKVGTLSKALGAQGGFVCGSRVLVDWLVNHARTYIYSTALAPPTAAAARCAVRIVQEEPQRRRHVLELAGLLRSRLEDMGPCARQASRPSHGAALSSSPPYEGGVGGVGIAGGQPTPPDPPFVRGGDGTSGCQIVPVIVGEARVAVELSNRLEERGLLVPAIRPPSVPPGTARLRISLTAGHIEEDVQRLSAALHDCRHRIGPAITP